LLRGPAPYPPEWRWHYRPDSTARDSVWVLACALGLLCLLAISGSQLARRHSRRSAVALLCCATVLGWGLQVSLLALEDGRSAANILIKRTTSPIFTSYYTVAVSPDARAVDGFLDQHSTLLPRLQPVAHHASTHPPGAVLYYRVILAISERFLSQTEWPVATTARTLDINLKPFSLPADASRLVTALISSLLLLLFASATCWPITALARAFGMGLLDAARVGILWTLLPGPTLMAPELDQMLAFLVTSAMALLAISFKRTLSHLAAGIVAFGAGIAGGIALFVSYGSAIFLIFGGCIILALAFNHFEDLKRILLATAVAVAAAILVNALPMIAGHEPIEAAQTAFKIHREYYTSPRSYLLWLPFNLWDLAVFLGFPLTVLALTRMFSVRSHLSGRWLWLDVPIRRVHITTIIGLFILNASGVVRGEAGRIWIPIMAFLLIAVLARDHTKHQPQKDRTEVSAENFAVVGPSVSEALMVGVLLSMCCWVLRLSWHLP
jgi:MFS family permease